MGEHLFSAVLLSFISAVLYHISHTALRESVRAAMGVVLLLFMLSPVASLLSGILDIRLPSTDLSFDADYTVVAEEAYVKGIRSALASEFNTKEECFTVFCEGFDFENMYSEKIHVTVTGGAALVDFRLVRDFVENSVNTGGCVVVVEIG